MQRMHTLERTRSWSFLDQNSLHAVLLGVVLLCGIVLRFIGLGTQSYRIDEITMINVGSGSLQAILSVADAGGGRPPAYVLLAHFWMQLFGTSEGATRSLSAVISCVNLGLLYAVGRSLFDRRTALIATVLMVVAEFQIANAQDFRYYSLLVFFALLSYLSLIWALRTNRWLLWIGYVTSTVLLFFAHSFGIFIICGQGLYMLLRWNHFRSVRLRWFLGQCVIGLAVVTGIWNAFSQVKTGDANPMQWIPDRPLYYPLLTLIKFVFPGRHLPGLGYVVAAVACAALMIGLWVVLRGRNAWLQDVRELPGQVFKQAIANDRLLLLGIWLAAPILSPFLLSKVFGPMYLDRYTIGASPALYLLLALAIVWVSRVVPIAAVLCALAILIAPGLREYYTTPISEQWREVTALVQAQAAPGDSVVFLPSTDGSLQRSFNWYYRGDLPRCDVDALAGQDALVRQGLHSCTTASNRFWLVMRGTPEQIAPFITLLDQPDASRSVLSTTYFKDVTVKLFLRTRS